VFVPVHGRSLKYSRQWNVAPQQNTNVNSVQGKQVWQTHANENALAGMGKARAGKCRACVHEGHAQAWA